MARIRTIKPAFFTSLTIARCSHTARLTFIGLWTHCDDEGRCVDNTLLIKAAVWPLERTVKQVESDLDELAEEGLIDRYATESGRYLEVRNWREHQKINRPTPSDLPPLNGCESSLSTHGALSERAVSRHGALTEGSRQERKGREGKGREGREPTHLPADDHPDLHSEDPSIHDLGRSPRRADDHGWKAAR
jgi:hypothetical protein